MIFYPGQLVVCINAGAVPEATNYYPGVLREGHIYTVREVVDNAHFQFPGYGIRVESVRLPESSITGVEETWHPFRFSPYIRTDISVFTRMLEKVDA